MSKEVVTLPDEPFFILKTRSTSLIFTKTLPHQTFQAPTGNIASFL